MTPTATMDATVRQRTTPPAVASILVVFAWRPRGAALPGAPLAAAPQP